MLVNYVLKIIYYYLLIEYQFIKTTLNFNLLYLICYISYSCTTYLNPML